MKKLSQDCEVFKQGGCVGPGKKALDLPKIKAVIIVTDDSVSISKRKVVCNGIAICFNPKGDGWKKFNGKRPWKSVDEMLDAK